jgi:hypothetical protein
MAERKIQLVASSLALEEQSASGNKRNIRFITEHYNHQREHRTASVNSKKVKHVS